MPSKWSDHLTFQTQIFLCLRVTSRCDIQVKSRGEGALELDHNVVVIDRSILFFFILYAFVITLSVSNAFPSYPPRSNHDNMKFILLRVNIMKFIVS
jgi:hypothetical protein